jgi:hypothetical protein
MNLEIFAEFVRFEVLTAMYEDGCLLGYSAV